MGSYFIFNTGKVGGIMQKLRSLQKILNKNNEVIEYTLIDSLGNVMDVNIYDIAKLVKDGEWDVVNLELIQDPEIDLKVSFKEKELPEEYKKLGIREAKTISDSNAISLVNKARIFGNIEEIPTACGHKCVVVHQKPERHILYIPDTVTSLNNINKKSAFSKAMHNLHGEIIVVGGKNLENTANMFYGCKLRYIDCSNLNTSKVTDMRSMFEKCATDYINFDGIDTHNVIDFSYMFNYCRTKLLDLSSLNTESAENMSDMFSHCITRYINVSSFDTHNVTKMQRMFKECFIQAIDLSNFDTSSVTSMKEMFRSTTIVYLDLSSFNTNNVKNILYMFWNCQKLEYLDLSSFKATRFKGCDMTTMFDNCETRVKITDKLLLDAYSLFRAYRGK